jgi:ABC-2 type transport system ATP-binding protein
MQPDAIIAIENLSKTYKGSDAPALKNISLSIPAGEIFGLLGPNGAGKTTTIGILCGFLRKDSGNITIDGMSIDKNPGAIRKITGLVPQEIALYDSLTAVENLEFLGNMYRMNGTALKKRIEECLALMGLDKNKDKTVKTYSGGMKRRLNLVAGLLHEPKILFLDEPTVGVDVQSRNVILAHLESLSKNGTTIVYTSHYMEEAEQLCSSIAIIDAGTIIAGGKPAEMTGEGTGHANLESLFLHLTGRKLRDNE